MPDLQDAHPVVSTSFDASSRALIERLSALPERYRVQRSIGEGATAVVFLARDTKHDCDVALKVLRPELARSITADRFVREIGTVASLTHPHILPLFDSGEADGLLYYVMPFVAGESLRARIKRERQLPLDAALGITCEIASALSFAHARGIVHR